MAGQNQFNVLAMAEEYAKSENKEVSDLFAKPQPKQQVEQIPVPEVPAGAVEQPTIAEEDSDEIPVKMVDDKKEQEIAEVIKETGNDVLEPETPDAVISGTSNTSKPKKATPAGGTGWMPDAELLEGMDEFTPVTYSKEELIEDTSDQPLKNIADENAIQEAMDKMDELERKRVNIEEAKARHGIKVFRIPEGVFHVRIFAAAGDNNHKRAQEELDKIFNEIKTTYPQFIASWEDGTPNVVNGKYNEKAAKRREEEVQNEIKKREDETGNTISEDEVKQVYEDLGYDMSKDNINRDAISSSEGQDPVVKIIIDKRNLDQVSFSKDDLEKIRKSRTVELNIVEHLDIDYSQIDDVPDNAIDEVLAPYQRTVNDVTAALPASKYRATFTGLTYPEVLDLQNSVEMNDIDGERKKWTICFNHIKNMSIGPWEEYQWYTDPTTNEIVRIGFTDPAPVGILRSQIHVVTKFDDFLKKTSFLDLDFMLWKILCATAMETEIISIDCHANITPGVRCDKSYDWVYAPNELLLLDTINPAILEEMEKTATVTGKDEILANYNSSMLRTDNTIKLAKSGFTVVFGHISAYDYLNSVYMEIEALKDMDENDPTIGSRSLNYILLTSIKAFLIPKEGGRWGRITGIKNLSKSINTLNEIDWLTLQEIVRIMIEPYQFQYALRDVVCPHCKNRSTIDIDNMAQLLFIVAQSLNSVDVTLKRV